MFQKIFSILKKNKMFFLLILAFLVCPMNAKAVQIYYTNKLQFSTLDGGPYYVGDLPTPIYSVKLGGVTSTCIDPAVNSGSGKLYIRGGVVPDTYPNYIERRYYRLGLQE